MLNDSKGQISIELVLVLAFILIIVLAIVQYIGPDLEQDEVMSSAKMGFMNASNDIAYAGSGNNIKFNNMTFNNGTITVTCYSETQLSSTDNNTIKSEMLNSIAHALNTNVVNNTVKGRYTYKININDIT